MSRFAYQLALCAFAAVVPVIAGVALTLECVDLSDGVGFNYPRAALSGGADSNNCDAVAVKLNYHHVTTLSNGDPAPFFCRPAPNVAVAGPQFLLSTKNGIGATTICADQSSSSYGWLNTFQPAMINAWLTNDVMCKTQFSADVYPPLGSFLGSGGPGCGVCLSCHRDSCTVEGPNGEPDEYLNAVACALARDELLLILNPQGTPPPPPPLVFADDFFAAFYPLLSPTSPATTAPTDAPTTAAPTTAAPTTAAAPTNAPTTAQVAPVTLPPVVSTLPALAGVSVLVNVVQGTAAAPSISLQLTSTVTSLDAAGEAAVKADVKRVIIAHAAAQGITITDADFAKITIRFVGADRDASQSFAARARRAFDDHQRKATIVIKVAMQDTVSNEDAVAMAESIATATTSGASVALQVAGFDFAIAGVEIVVLGAADGVLNKVTTAATSAGHHGKSHSHTHGHDQVQPTGNVGPQPKSMQQGKTAVESKSGKRMNAAKMQSAKSISARASPVNHGLQQMLVGIAVFVGVIAVAKTFRDRHYQQSAWEEVKESEPITQPAASPHARLVGSVC